MKKFVDDRHYAFALASVLAMFVGTMALWWFVLIGGNPYHPQGVRLFNIDQHEASVFHRGDWVIVRRVVCLDREILAEYSPTLYDINRRATVPLLRSSVISPAGCSERSAMFQIPPTLPPGTYEYRNVARFQNNLVGRDEANAYPPTRLEVIP